MLPLQESGAVNGNPLGYTPEAYVAKIRKNNVDLLATVDILLLASGTVQNLERLINTEHTGEVHVALATTGSDGREEKKGNTTSPLECILLVDRTGKSITKISQRTRERCLIILKRLDLFVHIQFKDLNLENVAFDYNYPVPAAWPTQIIDSIPLVKTNAEMVALSRQLLAQEAVGSEADTIMKAVKNRLAEYKKVCRNGTNTYKGMKATHFEPEGGLLHYAPDQPIKKGSTKHGPLRTVQMFLAQRILQFIRSGTATADFMPTLPANTEDKIAAMLDAGALSLTPESAQELNQLYKYFLWCFYLSEYNYSTHNKEELTQVPDAKLFAENLRNLLKLIEVQK